MRGHVGVEGNECADVLAGKGAMMKEVEERDWAALERVVRARDPLQDREEAAEPKGEDEDAGVSHPDDKMELPVDMSPKQGVTTEVPIVEDTEFDVSNMFFSLRCAVVDKQSRCAQTSWWTTKNSQGSGLNSACWTMLKRPTR